MSCAAAALGPAEIDPVDSGGGLRTRRPATQFVGSTSMLNGSTRQ